MCIFVFFFSSRRRHTRCLSDWSSDVCSSDLQSQTDHVQGEQQDRRRRRPIAWLNDALGGGVDRAVPQGVEQRRRQPERSEEHTSELQSLRHLVCRLLLEKKKNTTKSISEYSH